MANVMTNQVNQMYVVKAVKETDAVAPKSETTTTTGDVNLVKKSDDVYYFAYKGADTKLRSDLMKKGQVTEVRYTPATVNKTYLKQVIVTLNSTVNGGAPIVGEDYELKIAISQYLDLAEDSVYYKYGFVHATTLGTPDAGHFYYEMAKSLYKNFSREVTKLFEFYVSDDTNTVNIADATYNAKDDAKDDTITVGGTTITVSNITKLILMECEQDWNLGLMPKTTLNFKIVCDEVNYNGDLVKWGTVTVEDGPGYINNGYTLADMEYFYMGERGDQYRMFARPQDRIPTKLLIDPTAEYDVINIHYYFVDSLGGVQKSEKDLTLVALKDTTNFKTFATKIATALGCTLVEVK